MAVKAQASRRESSRAISERPMAVTTVRIYADQRDALQRAALDRRSGGVGRMDASAVLRELLDQVGMRSSENG